MPEINELLLAVKEQNGNVNKLLHDFQSRFDELLKEQKTGSEDVVTKESVKKIETALDKFEEKAQETRLQLEDERKKRAELEEKLLNLEKSYQGGGKARFGTDGAEEKFDFGKAVRGIATGYWEKGRTVEQKSLKRVWTDQNRITVSEKALIDDSASGGQYLIPDIFAGDQIIKPLQAAQVFSRLPGVTRLDNQPAGSVLIPRITAGTTFSMVGFTDVLGRTVNASSPTIDQVSVAEKIGQIVCPIGNEIIDRGQAGILQIVQDQITRDGAVGFENEYLFGTGLTTHISGIVNDATEVEMGTDGAKFTATDNIDKLFVVEDTLQTANSQLTAWLMNPRAKSNLRRVKTEYGDYLLTVPNNAGDPPNLIGYPYFVTTTIPNNLTKGAKSDCTTIFAGDWKDLIIVTWANVLLEASRVASYTASGSLVSAFERRETVIRLNIISNIALKHTDSFVKLTGIRDQDAT